MTFRLTTDQTYRCRNGEYARPTVSFSKGPGTPRLFVDPVRGVEWNEKGAVTIGPPGWDIVGTVPPTEPAAAPKQQADEPAWKQDAGKDRLDLIAPEFLFATARVLAFGAKKYADRNWEKGMSWGRVFGAMMRHMWAWWGGQGPTTANFVFGDLDSETSYSHLWHAACCLMFLIAYEERKIGMDDRHKAA